MDKLAMLLATFFGIGRLPWAPGTWASLAAVFLFWPLLDRPWVLAGILAVFFALSIPACTRAEGALGEKDPGALVADEVLGMGISLLFLPQPQLYFGIMAFILFRLFDIWKPFPIRIIQKAPGGWGVMLDDLLAGIYANVCLQAASTALSLVS